MRFYSSEISSALKGLLLLDVVLNCHYLHLQVRSCGTTSIRNTHWIEQHFKLRDKQRYPLSNQIIPVYFQSYFLFIGLVPNLTEQQGQVRELVTK